MTENHRTVLREFLSAKELTDSLLALIDERIEGRINDIGSHGSTSVDRLYAHVEREGAITALREIRTTILFIRDEQK